MGRFFVLLVGAMLVELEECSWRSQGQSLSLLTTTTSWNLALPVAEKAEPRAQGEQLVVEQRKGKRAILSTNS